MMAISQILKEILMQNTDSNGIQPMECSKRMLVLSLGTGEAKDEEKYTAATASTWCLLNWLYDFGATPCLMYMAMQAVISDMVDFHVSTLFQALDRKNSYLRIQVPILF
jgi:hypothetical protein